MRSPRLFYYWRILKYKEKNFESNDKIIFEKYWNHLTRLSTTKRTQRTTIPKETIFQRCSKRTFHNYYLKKKTTIYWKKKKRRKLFKEKHILSFKDICTENLQRIYWFNIGIEYSPDLQRKFGFRKKCSRKCAKTH